MARHGISKHQDRRDFWALRRIARMPTHRRRNTHAVWQCTHCVLMQEKSFLYT